MDDRTVALTSWRNDEFLRGDIRGVAVMFQGFNHRVRENGEPLEIELGNAGILVVSPYYGPWSWMNRNARAFVDELLAAVYRRYGLSDDVPLISCGRSMGGCAALLYCRYGALKPVGCMAQYPVCDLFARFVEDPNPDSPPAYHHAFYGYSEPPEEILREHSPLHQAEFMPDIPYLFFHGTADARVNKALHTDRMVQSLRRLGRDVTYIEITGMKHGRNIPLSVYNRQYEFIVGLAKR